MVLITTANNTDVVIPFERLVFCKYLQNWVSKLLSVGKITKKTVCDFVNSAHKLQCHCQKI